MKKAIYLISFLVLTALVYLLYTYKDYFPPRTPLKIARINSNLSLSEDLEVVDYIEKNSFNGEGFVYIVLKVKENTMVKIIEKSKIKGYKELTIENLKADKFITSNPEYGIKINGKDPLSFKNSYYKLNAIDLGNLDFGITIIDTENKEIIVYVSIP